MKNPGIKYGLLGGLAVVLYFMLFYFAEKALFLNPVVQWSSMVIYVACMFQAAREDVAAMGSHRDFRAMVRIPFLAFVLISLAYWLFYYSIHLADPELLRMETAAQLELLRKQVSAGTGDPEQANKIREQIQYLEQQGMGVTLGPILLQMAMGMVGGFGLAAIISAILKNKPKG